MELGEIATGVTDFRWESELEDFFFNSDAIPTFIW